MTAFLTGSHVYGTPHQDSDVDLVVLIDSDQLDQLLSKNYEPANYGATAASMRFGELNLICLADANEFEAWRQATNQLKARKPVTRDEAVALIKATVQEFKHAEAM